MKKPDTLVILGGFDVLHSAHRLFIKRGVEQFKQTYGRYPTRIIVRLNTDEYLNKVKGKYRPFFSYEWRKEEMLNFLENKFGGIIASFVLPYLVRPEVHILEQEDWEVAFQEHIIALEIDDKTRYVIQSPMRLKKWAIRLQAEGYLVQSIPESRDLHSSNILERLLEARDSSKCKLRRVGAVLVRQGEIVASAYNGPYGKDSYLSCPKYWAYKIGRYHISKYVPCKYSHAEERVLQKAKPGDYLFVTTSPCIKCAKLSIEKGITRLVYFNEYPDPAPLYLLGKAGIKYRKAGV